MRGRTMLGKGMMWKRLQNCSFAFYSKGVFVQSDQE